MPPTSDLPAPPPGVPLWDLLSIRDETDSTGRLLLEDSAPKRARRKAHKAGVAMASVACSYGDTPSRVGGLMNQPAYDALRHDTAEVLSGFAWLTGHYLQAFPSRRSSVRLLFDISHIGIILPLLTFHRAEAPIARYGRLPPFIASTFKASRGVSSAAVDMLNKAGPPTRKVTAAEIIAFADREGHLRRAQTDRACAAPTRLIERTLEVLLTGEGADPAESSLGRYYEFPHLWAFYEANDSFSQAMSTYSYVLNQLMASGLSPDPAELFRQRVPVGGGDRTFGDFTQAVIGHANAVQQRLNALLGRSPDLPPIGFEELTAML